MRYTKEQVTQAVQQGRVNDLEGMHALECGYILLRVDGRLSNGRAWWARTMVTCELAEQAIGGWEAIALCLNNPPLESGLLESHVERVTDRVTERVLWTYA